MTLINDLVEAASGSSTPTDELLRRLKVVAARAHIASLDDWVQRELDGYLRDEQEVPPYRGPFPARVLAQLSGYMGQSATNVHLDRAMFPDILQADPLWSASFRQGVAQLEEFASLKELGSPWPNTALALAVGFQDRGELGIDGRWSILTIRMVIERSTLVGVLRAVRDRVLTLALRLEQEGAGLGDPGSPGISSAAGRDIQIIMNGGVANFAVQSSQVEQHAVAQSDTDAIEATATRLRTEGVPESDVEALREAMSQDAQSGQAPRDFGPRTRAWLKDLAGTASNTVVSTATRILLEATVM